LVFIIILYIIYIISLNIIYCSDGSEDPHNKFLETSIAIATIKYLRENFGDGLVASAGVKGMAKLIAKSAPLGAKAFSLGLGAVASVIGKKGTQTVAEKALSGSNNDSNSSNTNSNISNNPILNSDNKSITENKNTMFDNLDYDLNILNQTNVSSICSLDNT
jgi:hypothetical protein